MEEPVSETPDEQIPGEGGEDETGVIPPAADEPAAPADPAPGAPADEPAPETPVEEPAPETPVEEEADAPAEEAPAEQPAEEVPVVDEEPAEETPVEEAAPADNYDINNVEIMVDEPAAAKVTITFDKFDAIRQNVKIEASTATPDDYKTIRKAGLVVNKNATVKIKLTPVAGFAIDTVKAGTAEQTGTADGTAKVYTVTPEANVTLAITAYPVYRVMLKDAADTAATGLSIKIEDSLKDAVVGSSDAKLTVAADGTATVKNAADKDFSFTLTDTALTDAKAIVSYSTEAEGSKTVITPKEVEKMEGQTTTTVNVYTVEKSVIANLDGALFIHLEKEAASTVTVGTGDDAGNNADVDITVPGKTAEEDKALGTDNNKAYIGDTFKFKVALKDTVKDTKTIETVAVKAAGDAEATPLELKDGVYSFEVKGNTTITVTTAYKDAASHLFKFTLASGSAEGSAEVAVKEIAVTKTEEGEVKTTTYKASPSGDDEANITTYPNMPAGQKLKAGEVLRLPNAVTEGTIKSITFTVTPVAAKGYELVPLNPTDTDEVLTTREITFVAGTATTGQTALAASGTENAITVGTQVKKSAGDVYFLPSTTDENLTINVPSGAGTKVEKIMDTGENADKVKAYKIASGEQRATFTVTAKAGHTLVKDDLTETNGVGSVTEETGSNGDITYTVTLFPSLITGTSASSVKEYTLTSEEPHFTAVMESPVEANSGDYDKLFEITSRKFTAPATTETPNLAATDVDNTANTNKGNIVYGSKLEIVITGKNGHTITGLTYTMGDVAGTIAPKIEEVMVAGTPASRATLTIPKVTGDVKFSVTTDESVYKLSTLKALDAEGTDVDPSASPDYIGEDDRYLVNHEKSYLVNVEKDGAALDKTATKDLTAVVTATKDGKSTAVRQSRKEFASGGLVIDLANKGLAGAEVKIEVSYMGGKVGVYNLTVSKETSEISVNEGKTIEQQVDSVQTYDVKTDGVLGDIVVSTTNGIIADAELDKDNKKLTITTAAVATDALKTGDTAKEDTVTIKAADNTDVECVVKVTATSFFDKAKTVTVEETSNAVADTVIGVTLTTGDVLKAGYKALKTGSLWYEVKAEAAATKSDAEGAPAFSTVEDKMVSPVTKYYKVKGASQREQIVVGQNEELGTGTDWPYTVSAKLVYLNAEPEGTPGADDIAAAVETTTTAKEAKISTKSPTFTAALKLQKVSKKEGGVTEVYTGQSGEMIIAQPTFKDKGFTANYQVVKSDISDLTSYGDLTFGVNAKGQIVVTSVSPTARIGKHTITVTARADETPGHPMYASKATTTINVVKGINKIDITQPGTVIYAGDPKKVASMKLGVNYNASDNGSWDVKEKKYITAPKKKSLEWSVVAREGDKEVPVSDTIAKYVTVDKKNGTIKVAKGFTPSSHAAENRFYVKAKATDFAGNEEYDYSTEFTVATEKLEIATLALVKETRDGNYDVVKVDSSAWNKKTPVNVTPAEVDDSTLYLFPANVTVEEKEYSASAWMKLTWLNAADFTFKSSAAKVVKVYNDGSLDALGAKKKVTITATANDGGKKKNSIVLNLGYDDISAPRLEISAKAETDAAENYSVSVCSGTDAPDGTNKVKKNIENVTGAARLKVQVLTKGEGDAYVNASNNANYKLTVKGGSIDKVMSSTNGTKYINTAAKTVTLTLTDNTTKPKKTVYTYELTNKAYELTTKAPKVKVTGSLYEDAKDAEQNVKINVKNADGTPAAYAKIELDWTSKTLKNYRMLNRLDAKMKANTELKHVFKLNDNEALGAKGDVDLTFKDLCKDSSLTPGSYKLKVTVVNASGAAQGLPTTATLKVVKRLKFTYKPTTSYTISKAEGGVMLTGKSSVKKGARADVYWSNLRNANVKGVSNNFTKFFTLVYDAETKTTMLKATDLFWAAQKGDTTLGSGQSAVPVPKFDPKNDLTGYVTCYASADKSFYNSEYYSEDVKLTIKLAKDLTKPAAKYAVNKPDVLLSGADAKTAVNVKIGNEFVKIGYAVPNAAKAASKELELVNDGDKLGVNAKGQVEVKVKSGVTLVEKKSYSIEIKALPANSVYAATIVAGGAGRAIAAGSADDMSSLSANTPAVPEPTTPEGIADKYGVPVKITVRGMSKPVNVTPDPVIPVVKEDIPDAVADAVAAVSLTAVDFTGTWENAVTSLTPDQKTAIIADATSKVNTALTSYSAYSINSLTAVDIVNVDGQKGGVKVTLTRDGYNDRVVTIEFTVNVTGGGSGTTSNTVTISGAENCTVKYAVVEKNATAPTEITTEVTGNEIRVEAGKDLYLKVETVTGYTVKTVKKGEEEKTGDNGVYKIGEITAATTVTITAEEDSSSSI